MPIYEYACPKCGTLFEELVRNAEDEAELACPVCGAARPERRMSACAGIVSGSQPEAGASARACASPAGGGFG